jgi:hypothetical protein
MITESLLSAHFWRDLWDKMQAVWWVGAIIGDVILAVDWWWRRLR